MTGQPVYIAGAGIISPLGKGLTATKQALRDNISAIAPLTLFPLRQGQPLPVGQTAEPETGLWPPRTHRLAREAAAMAMEGSLKPPDAIILGCTTGGILTTEHLLRQQVTDKTAYRYHGLFSLAEDIATTCCCTGPALTVSTACSSGTAALALALRLLRQGKIRRILAGGVDSLCRLTYFGFHSLQLVDRNGSRPLDVARQGLAVAEGAAMLLLTTEQPPDPLGVLLGAGLSCDAHHPTAPHPEGLGAITAMQAALSDAGIKPADIGYINLHGTGTRENDWAEAKAIVHLFPKVPPLSSIKGATGHSLAAAGAIEAVVAALAVTEGFIPGNTGCQHPDPELGVQPHRHYTEQPVGIVLSNSFGFGGNNGSVVIAQTAGSSKSDDQPDDLLAIHGYACLTGAGLTGETFARLATGQSAAGAIDAAAIEQHLPPRLIRRVKRLARLSLLLADKACAQTASEGKPQAIFAGTGWGALSETYDFLTGLTASNEQFPSPTDFVGSVHNGAAGQVALHLKATGANITTSGGDYSFEQALLAAQTLLGENESALVLGVDEGHPVLSPLLDPSIETTQPLADGGGALLVSRDKHDARCLVRLAFYQRGAEETLLDQLVAHLGGGKHLQATCAAVFAGIPAAAATQGKDQLQRFFTCLGQQRPTFLYRQRVGEFASASAVAISIAARCVEQGFIPGSFLDGADIPLAPGQRILALGTGPCLTAVELFKP